MAQYFKVDGQKLSYAEYWRMSPGPVTFVIAAALKFLRTPLSFNASVPRIDELDLIDEEDISRQARAIWKPLLQQCEAKGLRVQFRYTIPTLEENRESYATILLSEDGRVAANLTYVRTEANEKTAFFTLSRFPDGHDLIVSTMPKQMNPNPDDEIVHMPDQAPAALLDRHCEMIDSSSRSDRTPIRLNRQSLLDLVLEREQKHVDFHVARGVYVPLEVVEEEEEEDA